MRSWSEGKPSEAGNAILALPLLALMKIIHSFVFPDDTMLGTGYEGSLRPGDHHLSRSRVVDRQAVAPEHNTVPGMNFRVCVPDSFASKIDLSVFGVCLEPVRCKLPQRNAHM